MENPPHHVVALDRMHDGLFIFFEDGKRGFFSDELLYELLYRAGPVNDVAWDELGQTV